MIIGVDLDGVIFDTEEYYCACAELYDIAKGGKGMTHPTKSRIQCRYSWPDEYFFEYLGESLLEIQRVCPLKPYAKEVLNKLIAEGHKIIIVTARGILNEEEMEKTLIRLKKEEIPYSKIYFKQKNKLETCKKENIDVMIDDSSLVVEELSKGGVRCLHFLHFPYQNVEGENVHVVHNWGNVYRKIIEFSNKEKK